MKYQEVKKIFFVSFYAFCVAIFVVFLCQIRYENFFTIDDSQNEYLGFLRQYGRSWLSGEIPFITKDILIGSNAMVELQRGIFSPQNILASLITYEFPSSLATGIFYAITNIFICCISGYMIGVSFGMGKNLPLLLGFSLSINPIFLYQYSGPWWNAASGHAWSLMAIATFMLLRQKLTTKRILANYLSTVILLASGWPHGFIAYFVIIICISLVDIFHKKKYYQVLRCLIPFLLASFTSIPIYSEFLAVSNLIDRPSGFENADNFMVPSLSQLLVNFSATYYEFMNYFGGYKSVFIPVGFASPFILLSLFFFKISFYDKNISIFLSILSITLCLSLFPSQIGMLRWPIRFVPYFSIFSLIAAFYVIGKNNIINSKIRCYGFFLVNILIFIISASKNIFERPKVVFLEAMSFFILCGIWFVYIHLGKKINDGYKSIFLSAMIPVSCLVLMLASMPSLAKIYLPSNSISQKINKESEVNWNGNLLSLSGWSPENPVDAADLQSSLFGYYNLRTVNGYSPNGQKFIDDALVHYSPHGILQWTETLAELSSRVAPQDGGGCLLNLFGISTIVLNEQALEESYDDLLSCGYSERDVSDRGFIYLSTDKNYFSTLTYSSNYSVKVIDEKNNSVKLKIPSHNSILRLIFSREWWPGYSVHGLDCNVNTYGFQNMLLAVDIPSNCKGNIKISYFPTTWGYVLYCPILSIFGLIVFSLRIKQNQKLQRVFQNDIRVC